MAEPNRCSLCGAEMPPGAPEGLCPNCLLKVGLEPQSQAPQSQAPQSQPPASTVSAEKSSGFTPPTPQELNGLFPQLEFLELLGKGGMGAVYKARQKSLDRLVAVKILPPDVGLDPAFAERFTREARALAKLNHPHIVGIHDFGSVPMLPAPAEGGAKGGRGAGSIYYFMMEFVDGVNLRQAQRAGQLKPAQALQIVPQICDALQYAHEEGVVHRDIKPENILLDKRGRVKIADFGLAKLLGKTVEELTLTGTRQIVGTIPYMAPEQIEGSRDVDHRADIYSLGVTFYEMLTGELPLGRFPLPSHKVQIDVRLDQVVLRTLEKAPELRYQQAGEVKTEVETISRTPRGKPLTDVLKDVAIGVMHGGKRAAQWVSEKVTNLRAEAKPAAAEAKQAVAEATQGVAEAAQIADQAAQAADEASRAADKQAAEPSAEPAPSAGTRKKMLFVGGLIALAVTGMVIDLTRRHFAPLGTISGLTLLAVVAWKERGTPLGRDVKILLFCLLASYLVLEAVIHSPETLFAAVIGIVVLYLVWDAVRAAWNKTKPPAVEAAPPVAEKRV